MNKTRWVLFLVIFSCMRVCHGQTNTSYMPFHSVSDMDNKVVDLSCQVGAVDAQAAISELGAATYSIPIKMPPSTQSMAPKLSMVYNSNSTNGLLGFGWGLSFGSVISRGARTHHADGEAAPTDFLSLDALYLDGERLLHTSGTPGPPEPYIALRWRTIVK